MDIRTRIIEAAKPLIGTPYSKLDCSAFVRRVFSGLGYELPRTSVDQGKLLHDRKLSTEISEAITVTKVISMLKVGDLIFWGNPKYAFRWKHIHHVAIYMGDGKTIESTPSGHGVHIGNLWETREWQIVLIADITSLLQGGEEEMIKNGDKNDKVLEYQNDLVYLGYSVGLNSLGRPDLDGSFGKKTLEGHNAFQKAHGIVLSPDVNEETQHAMRKALREKAIAAEGNYASLGQGVKKYKNGVLAAANMKI
jgi:hypothetical protein